MYPVDEKEETIIDSNDHGSVSDEVNTDDDSSSEKESFKQTVKDSKVRASTPLKKKGMHNETTDLLKKN